MADITGSQAGLHVEITDAVNAVDANVRTTTPGGSDAGLVVREAARGQDTSANSMPVVIASDQSSLTVDDGGGSITVDGAVNVTTNSEYAEDSAHVDGDTGQFVLAVQNNTLAALATDGDYAPLQVNSSGALYVDIGSAGVDVTTNYEYAEDSAHADTDIGAFVLGVRNDTLSALAGTSGDYAPLQVNSSGAIYVDASQFTVPVSDNGGSLTVDGTVTANTNYEYAEDTQHTDGDTGAFVLGVRNDTLASLVTTDGDYAPLQVNADGALYVSVTSSGGVQQVEGNVAHDAVDSGNPVKIGAVARTTNPTPVADGDRSDIMCDDYGRIVVINNNTRDQTIKQYTAVNSTTETTILAAGGAGVFHDITSFTFNCDKNNVDVTVREATGGATALEVRLDQNDVVHLTFPTPLPQATANNNWTVQLSSGGATVEITVVAVKNT
jgi:hypothetical protein